MNLILLDPEEISDAGEIVLRPRQTEHVLKVLRSRPGDTLRVGVVGGNTGTATVIEVSAGRVAISSPILDTCPPSPWFDLLLAMPRPKVLHRMWAPMASLGVRNIFLANAAKVEKFYFDSHWLSPETYNPLLREGLEQSCTTAMPRVEIVRRFRPFVEDEIPRRFADAPKLVAHPRCDGAPPRFPTNPPKGAPLPLVAVGPEGGWTDFELELLSKAGFAPFSLGERILRTDIALPVIAGAIATGQ